MNEILNTIFGGLGVAAILYLLIESILKRKKYRAEVQQADIQNKRDTNTYIDEAIVKSTNTNANLLKKIDDITSDYLEISKKYLEIQQKYNEIFENFKNYSCVVPACPQRILYKMQQVLDHTLETPIQNDNKE